MKTAEVASAESNEIHVLRSRCSCDRNAGREGGAKDSNKVLHFFVKSDSLRGSTRRSIKMAVEKLDETN